MLSITQGKKLVWKSF